MDLSTLSVTVNSQQLTVNSQQLTVNSQQLTVNSQQLTVIPPCHNSQLITLQATTNYS
ncbi:hypothetical protein QT971_07120 [Microcoleus sp. herbarium19]|uniref:hypothetical protein n=1 Tax=unclassified Microcoleus TaxID=2642155 RepID=UPI002FD79456